MCKPSDHHQHDHHHDHGHGHEWPTFGLQGPDSKGDDFTAKNKAHWDEYASKYTEHQWQRDMISQINGFISAHIDWMGIKPTDKVLDYACGPGTVTNALGSRASTYQGVDLSDNMVKAYNLRFESQKDFSATAAVGNLLTDSLPEHLNDPKYFNFDLAAIGLGFHHFEKLELCLQRLRDRLKPGGTLLIVDLLTHEPEEKYKTIVAHNGFSEGQMRQLYAEVGLSDVDIVVMEGEVFLHGTKPRKVFMARGTKTGEKL